MRCFLLNISHVILSYGSQPHAVLESVPQLYADDKDLVVIPPGGQGREQLIEGNLLGAKEALRNAATWEIWQQLCLKRPLQSPFSTVPSCCGASILILTS